MADRSFASAFAAASVDLPKKLDELWAAASDYDLKDGLWSLLVVTVALTAGRLAASAVIKLLRRWAKGTRTRADDEALDHLERPARYLAPLILARAVIPLASVPPRFAEFAEHVLLVGAIVAGGWMAMGAVRVVEAFVRAKLDMGSTDNLRARQLATSTRALRNIADFVVVVLTIGLVLMTFAEVRQVGSTILASAGVAGLVIGFAAQKSIATLLSGIQIAVTQPMRVDDVVVVEGEWGRIEEITLTYVVIRIWDLRRLIVPIQYFLEKPFQNWTRVSAEVLGTVELHVDYTVPVDEIREEFKRILDGSDKWDKKTWSVQVTASSDRSMIVRPLFGAKNSSDQWDLRCEVREKLVAYLQRQHPSALPRFRAAVEQRGAEAPLA